MNVEPDQLHAGADPARVAFDAQRRAILAKPDAGEAERRDRLDRAIALIRDREAAFIAALAEDFSLRAPEVSLMTDVGPSLLSLKHARAHLRAWMRPERRGTEFPLGLFGARARVRYRPKGVVGIMSPWNFPLNLSFAPLAGALAAGNRVMIKPSEFTPATSEVMAEAVAARFAPEEIAVIPGGKEVSVAFSQLPFDHLIFTGSTATGRHVMRAAAATLTPVTLELGGRCPAVVAADADLELAARRIATAKLLNAGQICLAPNHVWVERAGLEPFVAAISKAMTEFYPGLPENGDYTAIITEAHADRLDALVEAASGARIVRPFGDNATRKGRVLPPVLVIDPDPSLDVMTQEIFGPVLPILPYDDLDEVAEAIATERWPLAMYVFLPDRTARERLLGRTSAGAVAIDDCLVQHAQEDLPFGGIGLSGMGAYHGKDGFRTFSHAQAVFSQARFDPLRMMRPPYGRLLDRVMRFRMR